MPTKQRIAFSLCLLTLFMGTGIAVWTFAHQGTTGFIVSSTYPLTYEDSLSITPADTTSTGATKDEAIKLINANDDIDLLYTIDIVNDDVADGCTPTGDYTIDAVFNGSAITNGSLITSHNGATEFINLTSTLESYSCPGNWTSTITLTPQ